VKPFFFLAFFFGSFLVSLLLTPLVRRIALSTGHVATPKDSRWHKKPTALFGGVSIFIAVVSSWIAGSLYLGWKEIGYPYLPIILCAGGTFFLGLIDDLRDIKPQQKLAGQIVFASLLMLFGFRLHWINSEGLDVVLSIIWVVGITNALNLLDNMDGLAAGVAFIAAGFLMLNHISALPLDATPISFIAIVAAYLGALLGFLFYNFNPASIFMGDAGSLFIGFVLASLCMMQPGQATHSTGGMPLNFVWTMAVPILILLIPILDTAFVSIMRTLFHRPISQGGRDHSSHRMVAIGFSEKKSVLILYLFAAVSGMIALSTNYLQVGTSVVLVIVFFLFVLFFWIYLAKVKVYPEKSIFQDTVKNGITPLLIEITYRRKLFEVLLDFILVGVAYYTAYLLRFDGNIGGDFSLFIESLPLMIACQVISFYLFGVYRGIWESTGIRDLIVYIKAITAGTVAPMLLLLFLYRFGTFSRAVFLIYWGLMVMLVSVSRLSFRVLDEGIKKGKKEGKPTLIYGAGAGGQLAVREIEGNEEHNFNIVGFADDDPRKQKMRISGYPVLGSGENITSITAEKRVETIIVSFKVNAEEKHRQLRRLCLAHDREVTILQMSLRFKDHFEDSV